MGLDMSFYANGEDGERIHFQYFRKHATLHDFILKEYLRLNPDKDVRSFNCTEFEITPEFMESLESFCAETPMSRTHYEEECFWSYSLLEDWKETNDVFIPKAKDYMKAGYKITYVPWW